MNSNALPLIVDPDQLATQLKNENILLIDLSTPQTYVQYHIPGAYAMEYQWIVHSEKPRMGLLPDTTQLSHVFSAYGLTPDAHVVAYDDEGGGRASRLLWTLDCIGHKNYSLLDGGIQAWVQSRHEVTGRIEFPKPSEYRANINDTPIADRQYILEHLNQADTLIIDARSAEEYSGTKRLAARGGHIPGAIHIDWTQNMDFARQSRLKSPAALRELLQSKGITEDKQIVCYCQTHHRSALTYIVLKYLGFTRVKGYPGSWSDWGNEMRTPVE